MAANTMAITSSILDEPVDYRDLKEWIEEQERNPKPLSPLQQRAISDLRRSIEPELGARDWVSLLNRYSQAHGSSHAFIDEPAPDERWAYRCLFKPTANTEQMSFPNAEAGFTPNEHGVPAAPSFGRKKDAKQYAAKCCIEWLMKGGYMPSDGINVEFPKPPKTSRHASGTPTPGPAAKKLRGGDNPDATPNRPKKRAADGDDDNDDDNDDDDDDDDDQPATKRVETLCRLLCLTIPQYRITPTVLPTTDPSTTSTTTSDDDPTTTTTTTTTDTNTATTTPTLTITNPQFFDGHADFGPDAIKVPEGLGRVSNVYGRRNARERAAEEVLAWLVAEEAQRMVEADQLFAEMGVEVPPAGGGGGGADAA